MITAIILKNVVEKYAHICTILNMLNALYLQNIISVIKRCCQLIFKQTYVKICTALVYILKVCI